MSVDIQKPSQAKLATPSDIRMAPKENVFLFWPNIIGMLLLLCGFWCCQASPSGPVLSLKSKKRITDHCFCVSLGYTRVLLTVVSLYYMPLHPRTCSLLYSISCLLDALDGYAARHFNQSTTFGAVLDMVTDRCTTACLLVFLSSAWPRWAIIFQMLISLDMASHYMHMYATLTMGGGEQSHKKIDAGRSKILYLYYTNKVDSQKVL